MEHLHHAVHIYDLPPTLIVKHQSTNPQAFILQELRDSIAAGPFLAPSPTSASFFLVPIAFPPMGRGRQSVAAVLTYLRLAYPFFNASLTHAEPNHLVVYAGDMAMDVPPSKRYEHEPLPPELDVAHKRRHWVALTLTGNPEAGFRPGRDVVLPPSHNLKSGPDATADQCCSSRATRPSLASASTGAAAHPRRCKSAAVDRSRCCKPTPIGLADSTWAPLHHLAERPWRASWAGQASGGGMGRHGGSGPRVRRWLRAAADELLAHSVLVTDTNTAAHLDRNRKLAPTAPGLFSPAGRLVPGAESKRALACVAPYGRGNGWEGRSAAALRDGCVPLTVQPPRAALPLDEWVPYERFALKSSDRRLNKDGVARLAAAVGNLSLAVLNKMRCEMACAAAHMSWNGAGAPPASCAGGSPARTGAVATLVALLHNRRLHPAHGRRVEPVAACPCHAAPCDWHLFEGLESCRSDPPQ